MARSWVDPEAAVNARFKPLARILLSLILFGVAFGFVEAAVVVYLRTLAQPIRAGAGLPASDIFPLLNVDAIGPVRRLVGIELAREGATLVMLATVAWAVAGNARAWLAAFGVAFGVWDLTFYAWLWVMIGWPTSLSTWDLLFLLPVPWAAPVLAPVIVAGSVAVGGAIALARLPERVSRFAWTLMLLGAVVLLVSFMWDWRYWVAGGMPRAFPWMIFAAGEILGMAGFVASLRNKTRPEPV